MAGPKTPLASTAPYNWTGFYVGANGGYGFGSSCWNFGQFPASTRDQGCDNLTGGFGGGQFGFNWQTGSVVLGLEISGSLGEIKGSHVPPNASQGTEKTNISQIVTMTGRIGYAWDQYLVYGKGGLAFVRQHLERTCNGVTSTGACTPVGAISSYGDQVRQSWIIGGGVEYALTRNLSLALEYSYLPMGTQDGGYTARAPYSCGFSVGTKCQVDTKENLSIITARLNWRFGRL